MKRLLTVGDKVYGQSLQHFVPSYLQGFPQRQKFLLECLRDRIHVDACSHVILKNEMQIAEAQTDVVQQLQSTTYDGILIENPLSIFTLPIDGPPIIFDCIDWYEEMYEQEFGRDDGYSLLKRAMAMVMQRADIVVAQSPVILADLKKRGLKTHKTIVIPNGFDHRYFFPYPELEKKQAMRTIENRHAVSLGDKKIIVYTGKLNAWYEDIVTVAKAITHNQLFLIVGDGPLVSHIPRGDNIVMCGPVDFSDVALYTNTADVAVFPVAQDCSPIAISEYLAVGKPIVMNHGRMEWLLKEGVHAAFVEPGSVASWREGIQYALCHGEAMGSANRRLAMGLSWKHLADKLNSFLHANL